MEMGNGDSATVVSLWGQHNFPTESLGLARAPFTSVTPT